MEETATGEVVPGFETGVGPAAVTYGGMAVLGDELTLVCRHTFAKNKNVFIIIPLWRLMQQERASSMC